MLEFFSWKKFECGKNLRVSLFPYPKGPPKRPLYGAESKKFSGLLHLGHTFRTYIQNYIYNIHLEITFPTHIRITLDLPRSFARSSTYSSTTLHKIPPILFTFRTYIRITLNLSTRSFACLLHHLLYAHPQTFYHIIITFRTYIQNYILTHIITTL